MRRVRSRLIFFLRRHPPWIRRHDQRFFQGLLCSGLRAVPSLVQQVVQVRCGTLRVADGQEHSDQLAGTRGERGDNWTNTRTDTRTDRAITRRENSESRRVPEGQNILGRR
jgi:hypothetical protein